ncbi:MAG TPA: cupin domain-containing protein [Burkholderiales bacterium]|nr:cupin domain-containing protein [Burkholderiales bacterium]
MRVSLKLSVLAFGLALGTSTLPLARGDMDQDMKVLMNGNFVTADPENIKWEKNKSTPYGMVTVLLYGTPGQPGPYIFRAKMPSGYKLPPHRHPDERIVTVLKGTYWSGIGERYDPMKMAEFQVGAFYVTKAGTPHYSWARTEVIIQEMGTGPESGIQYVNPDDDPRH